MLLVSSWKENKGGLRKLGSRLVEGTSGVVFKILYESSTSTFSIDDKLFSNRIRNSGYLAGKWPYLRPQILVEAIQDSKDSA